MPSGSGWGATQGDGLGIGTARLRSTAWSRSISSQSARRGARTPLEGIAPCSQGTGGISSSAALPVGIWLGPPLPTGRASGMCEGMSMGMAAARSAGWSVGAGDDAKPSDESPLELDNGTFGDFGGSEGRGSGCPVMGTVESASSQIMQPAGRASTLRLRLRVGLGIRGVRRWASRPNEGGGCRECNAAGPRVGAEKWVGEREDRATSGVVAEDGGENDAPWLGQAMKLEIAAAEAETSNAGRVDAAHGGGDGVGGVDMVGVACGDDVTGTAEAEGLNNKLAERAGSRSPRGRCIINVANGGTTPATCGSKKRDGGAADE